MSTDDNFKPGTRWRDRHTYEATESNPYGHRLAGLNPRFIVAATDDWIIYRVLDDKGEQIGSQRARKRDDFVKIYEPSCCEKHDREPFHPKPCNAVNVPDRGAFFVVNGRVHKVLSWSLTSESPSYNYASYNYDYFRRELRVEIGREVPDVP